VTANNHPLRPEELMAYLDGELLPARAGTAEEHLEQCDECRTLRAELESVSGQMREWQVEVPPFGALYSPKPANAGNRRLVLALAAAAVVCAIGLYSFVGLGRRGIGLYEFKSMTDSRLQVSTKMLKSEPMLVHGAGLTIICKDFDRARAAMDRILAEHHGYVAQLQMTDPAGNARSLNATLNTPATDLEATVDQLKGMGRVQSETRSATEVTDQVVDVDARLANARVAERRLSELLNQRTGSVSDVLAVENQIDETRETIEKLVAQKGALNDRLAFSAIALQLNEEEHKPAGSGPALGRLRDAAILGYANLVNASAAILAFLLSYGPALVLWSAILFFPARFAWRVTQARR
jgi:hypothetical protein